MFALNTLGMVRISGQDDRLAADYRSLFGHKNSQEPMRQHVWVEPQAKAPDYNQLSRLLRGEKSVDAKGR